MEGKLIHGYEYDSLNRLSKSWNDRGGESCYLYNGLGQRMGRSINGREEDYLLDLTKPYHNLMGIYKEEECSQRFYLDGTAAAMEEASKGKKPSGRTAFSGLHYYLQDELGSPLRVSGFRAKEGAVAGRNNYLTYGYDEFGNDPGKELEEAGIPNPYDGQGMEQPFGYTGYRYDEGSGTYFAQAREYLAGDGRFVAEDVIKGNGARPETFNQYSYCLDNSLSYVDWDGKSVTVAILVVVGLTLVLSGCGVAEEEIVQPVVRPLPSPTPTPQPTPVPQPTPTPIPQPTPQIEPKEYIKVEDYNVSERKEFIEFMKYAESGGNYNGALHDANGDGDPETIAYGHDTIGNGDKDLYVGRTLTEKEGKELLLKDLEERVPYEWLLYVEKGGHKFTAYEIDALVSLNYATNDINLDESPNFAELIKGEYSDSEVYAEFMTYDRNSSNSGLIKRHSAEAQIFLMGIYDKEFYDKGLEPCVQ